MPVTDYVKFLLFLQRGGVSPNDERLLSVAGVDCLTKRQIKGITAGPLGGVFGLGADIAYPVRAALHTLATRVFTSG
jgi:hypothetical protein